MYCTSLGSLSPHRVQYYTLILVNLLPGWGNLYLVGEHQCGRLAFRLHFIIQPEATDYITQEAEVPVLHNVFFTKKVNTFLYFTLDFIFYFSIPSRT
ncbi:uncharacterized protein BO66DRAFT_140045 [Aspergillus aculeatinus CBS 121060]|uniref:Uncharacterized protein n=1 Tax=Aspergillus aculeatinus CBS 121060 TaxID=1448322 RepID=A0ACD1H253_9EURO|nr:hypothetical protein BO66DRAFT_140045 [Aspergillus aculeatinus CBS 121060]RAH67832.1 hypothetical protein BO66DRAFT_140045 [Aspergillus aculeatinus CBS 121060]